MRRRGAAVALTLTLALAACAGGDDDDRETSPAADEALTLDTGPAPWPAPDRAVERIAAAGLPAPEGERLEYHIHAQLVVVVDGEQQTVPGSIGIDTDAERISPLHTHAEDGLLHVEAPEPRVFTLAQVFTEWGVRLDAQCVGGYCEPETPIEVYVDGEAHAGPPGDVELEDGAVIAVVIGDPPARVPGG